MIAILFVSVLLALVTFMSFVMGRPKAPARESQPLTMVARHRLLVVVIVGFFLVFGFVLTVAP